MTIHRVTCRDATDYGLDEIVAENVYFHIERMAAGHFWFQVIDNGRRIIVHLHQEGRKIVAVVEDESTPPSDSASPMLSLKPEH